MLRFHREEDEYCALLGYYAANSGTITTNRCDSLPSNPEQRTSQNHRRYTTVYPRVTLSKMQYNWNIYVSKFERSLKQTKNLPSFVRFCTKKSPNIMVFESNMLRLKRAIKCCVRRNNLYLCERRLDTTGWRPLNQITKY
jgi:hypothetical protein